MKWTIPGLKSVSVVRCDTLPYDITKLADAGGRVYVTGSKIEIGILPGAKLEVSETHRSNGTEYSVSLTFRTVDHLAYPFPVAFYVTDNDGDNHLVGVRESPWPIISVQDSTSEPDGQKSLEYTVTSVLPPVKCQSADEP